MWKINYKKMLIIFQLLELDALLVGNAFQVFANSAHVKEGPRCRRVPLFSSWSLLSLLWWSCSLFRHCCAGEGGGPFITAHRKRSTAVKMFTSSRGRICDINRFEISQNLHRMGWRIFQSLHLRKYIFIIKVFKFNLFCFVFCSSAMSSFSIENTTVW